MDWIDASIEKVFSALSSNYESVMVYDIDEKKWLLYRKNPRLPQEFWTYVEKNPSYEELLNVYVDKYVVNADKTRMRELLTWDSLKHLLGQRLAFSYSYRVNSDDGQALWYRVRFATLSEPGVLKRFVIGFENVSDELKYDFSFYKTGNKILVIEDNDLEREIIKSMLQDEYQVLEAKNGEEGLEILEEAYQDIAVILTDLQMPVCDGYTFLKNIREVRRYNSIPVIAMTAYDMLDAEVKSLELGASDFIHKPCQAEIVKHRIRSLVRLRVSVAMLNTLERDPLTGLYTKNFFYQYAQEIIQTNPDRPYWIVVSNIEKFKVINDKYGAAVGDEVLRHIAENAKKHIKGYVIGGRISSDKYVYLQQDIVRSLDEGKELMDAILQDAPVPNIVLKLGVYQVEKDSNLTVQMMCDRARLAMESIRGVYDRCCAFYDEKIRENMILQQQITACMDEALEKEQFQIYLQPKYNVKQGRIGGAEALIRWNHPELGFMSPGIFIPLFEKNAFIRKLDQYVLVRVCQMIQKWKEEGREMIPISVNLSRRDFEEKGLAEEITQVVDSYGLSHDLIHFELTESAFSNHPEQITEVISKLHENGFVIELDDFGTGYSSMTTLNSMDVDILKLDMSIIQNDVPGSERNVLDFCMQLAKMMKLETVAEGAETLQQTERLKDVGCDFVQGYFYSRPLPVDQFETYLQETKKES